MCKKPILAVTEDVKTVHEDGRTMPLAMFLKRSLFPPQTKHSLREEKTSIA
jgi:hypothetical protein